MGSGVDANSLGVVMVESVGVGSNSLESGGSRFVRIGGNIGRRSDDDDDDDESLGNKVSVDEMTVSSVSSNGFSGSNY